MICMKNFLTAADLRIRRQELADQAERAEMSAHEPAPLRRQAERCRVRLAEIDYLLTCIGHGRAPELTNSSGGLSRSFRETK